LQDARQAVVAKVKAVEGHWVQVEMQDGVTQDATIWMNFDRLVFIRPAACPPK